MPKLPQNLSEVSLTFAESGSGKDGLTFVGPNAFQFYHNSFLTYFPFPSIKKKSNELLYLSFDAKLSEIYMFKYPNRHIYT